MTVAAKKKQALTPAARARRPSPDKPPRSRIPEFKTLQEEADWWDTHDITDYLDELTPVVNPFNPRAPAGVMVMLAPEDMTKLKQRAQKRGLIPNDLAKEWIEERLRSA